MKGSRALSQREDEGLGEWESPQHGDAAFLIPECVFVYGTLRLHRLAHDLLRGRSAFVGFATVPGRLYDLGPFPGALPAENSDEQIHGEVHRLDAPDQAFRLLDEYEGCSGADPIPHAFRRDAVLASLESGDTIECAIYWFTGRPPEERRITSGDYLKRR